MTRRAVTRRGAAGLRAAGVLAVPAALARLGTPGLADAGIAAGLACWVLASGERTDRLARLITAIRRATPAGTDDQDQAPPVPPSGENSTPAALGARPE